MKVVIGLRLGNPAMINSSIESEAMLNDDSISISSIPSLHPSENTINEPYHFPSVGVDLFEENTPEDIFSSLNDQIRDSSISLETVDESFPSQELLMTKYVWDNHKYDSTQMVLIDSYEVYIE